VFVLVAKESFQYTISAYLLHSDCPWLQFFYKIYKPPVIACDDTCSALSTLLIGIYSDTSFMSACAQTAN